MKYPKYTEQLFAVIFLCVGCTFLFLGLLSFIGILNPTSHSMIQNNIIMGAVFSALGIAFLLTYFIFSGLASQKNKLHDELRLNGNKVTGTVEKVCIQRYMQYGQKSPYRIYYTYIYQDKVYHDKSFLLWEEPGVKEMDSVEVYVSSLGESTIQL